jgi:hypothetical protein
MGGLLGLARIAGHPEIPDKGEWRVMTLDIDQEAIEFIRSKGGICSIIETYPHQNSYVEIPITQIQYAVPEKPTGYDTYEREGITLNIGRSLFFQGEVIRIRVGRFLFFRWLELPTLTLLNSYG